MLSFPASMKRIRSRTAEKSGDIVFSHYKPMGIFFRRSRAAYSAVSGPSRPKFKLVRALGHFIITCKYEKDRIKKKTAEKKWGHRFLHYNPMGAFCCHGNQSSDPRFVSTWSITQKTGLLMTRYISANVSSWFAQRFFTLAKALQ